MNSRDFCKAILLISCGLLLVSCGVAMTKGQTWLDTKKDNPTINVTGSWTSPEWGSARLKQDGRDVSGALGDYPVTGVVSGDSLYLIMYSGKSIDYSAELKAVDNNTLKGSYSKYSIVEQADYKHPINLKRLD